MELGDLRTNMVLLIIPNNNFVFTCLTFLTMDTSKQELPVLDKIVVHSSHQAVVQLCTIKT